MQQCPAHTEQCINVEHDPDNDKVNHPVYRYVQIAESCAHNPVHPLSLLIVCMQICIIIISYLDWNQLYHYTQGLHDIDNHEVHDKMIDKFLVEFQQYDESRSKSTQQDSKATQYYFNNYGICMLYCMLYPLKLKTV